MSFVLAIDQGTTSSRAIVFRSDISIAATAQQEFPQHFPASGWVEHEPEDIWTSTIATCREALKKAGVTAKDIAAIGITNQRETTVVWDRATGKAVHRAIVWQDRRTADFGASVPELFGGSIMIAGIAGDQQAATIGQACFEPGMMKSTYGTGCFALLNTGTVPVASKNKLLTTIAYQLGGKRTYALEGSIFVAGSAVQWLRDGLGIIKQAAETGPLADKSDSMQSVYLVPAFVGMGAPYWNPNVRGALFGLTRNTGPAELAHAALESVCYQTSDLWAAMRADWPDASAAKTVLRVDGGMTASDWTMQRLADLLDAPVDRPMIQETTALGAAYLAGLNAGVYPEPAKFADNWRLEHRFKPNMSAATRERKLAGWARAVKGVLASDEGEV